MGGASSISTVNAWSKTVIYVWLASLTATITEWVPFVVIVAVYTEIKPLFMSIVISEAVSAVAAVKAVKLFSEYYLAPQN